MLPTKLRSELCANDLNHFQLKVPSGTFSIAEIVLTVTATCHAGLLVLSLIFLFWQQILNNLVPVLSYYINRSLGLSCEKLCEYIYLTSQFRS